VSRETYYYSRVFDTFDEAVKAQHSKLKEFIDEGLPIRDCGLDWETDFDTKKQKFRVLVRHHLIESSN
jgi:hypothetical protein